MVNKAICLYLPWDSEFFGIRIARVNDNRLSPHVVIDIQSWCDAQAIECLYFLADSNDVMTIRLAEEYGFKLTDIRMRLENQAFGNVQLQNISKVIVRPYDSDDIAELQKIASNAFMQSRFYFDECFPRELCNKLYEIWIRNCAEGFADFIFVAELNDKVVGFITCKLEGAAKAEIGLLAVAENARGQGIGQLLLKKSLYQLNSLNIGNINVVTQGRNIASQRLYQKCGFVTKDTHLWYHRWFSSSACKSALSSLT